MIQGQIDTTFTTSYRDMIAAGTIAEIGVNAFGVWEAIKAHADFNTGQAWPGMRTLGRLTGLSAATVQRAIQTLLAANLLRVIQSNTRRRGQTYLACERLRVTLGNTLICTVMVDYIPAALRQKVQRVTQALQTGENDPHAFASVTVIPSAGLVWDSVTCTLKGALPVNSLQPFQPEPTDPAVIAGKTLLDRLKNKQVLHG